MGDKKPKKKSSGKADAYKAKQAKGQASSPPASPSDKGKGKKR